MLFLRILPVVWLFLLTKFSGNTISNEDWASSHTNLFYSEPDLRLFDLDFLVDPERDAFFYDDLSADLYLSAILLFRVFRGSICEGF